MMYRIIHRIEATNECIGRAVAWLTATMVAVTFIVILLSFFFRLGWIWIQESVTYMHGILFTSAAAYTLVRDEHVRIDVFYARFGPRGKAWVNLLGTLLLLLPTCGTIAYFSFPYIAESWRILEASNEAGGIPAIFVLKTFILIFVALVAAQGMAIVLKNILVLCGDSKASSDGESSSPKISPSKEGGTPPTAPR